MRRVFAAFGMGMMRRVFAAFRMGMMRRGFAAFGTDTMRRNVAAFSAELSGTPGRFQPVSVRSKPQQPAANATSAAVEAIMKAMPRLFAASE